MKNFFVKRMRRRDYAIIIIIAIAFQAILYSVGKSSNSLGLAIFGLLGGVLVWVIFSIKRLHDCDMSGWFAILGFVPIVNYVFSIYLIVKKGTEGTNKYGADPKMT